MDDQIPYIVLLFVNKIAGGCLAGWAGWISWQYREHPRFRHIAPLAIAHGLLMLVLAFGVIETGVVSAVLLLIVFALTAVGFWALNGTGGTGRQGGPP